MTDRREAVTGVGSTAKFAASLPENLTRGDFNPARRLEHCTRSQTEGHGVTVIFLPSPLAYVTLVQITDIRGTAPASTLVFN